MMFDAQTLRGGMRVDLRGGQARVPEHLLDAAQIGASCQHVGGEGVAQIVGRDGAMEALQRQSACLNILRMRVGASFGYRRVETKKYGASALSLEQARVARTADSVRMARKRTGRAKGTMRSLDPLPSTVTCPWSKSTAESNSPEASDTRAPQAYRNSSSA